MAAALSDKPSTRARILDAALGAFADRGVDATSLDSLAVEIGIRKQTILYWFPSKEQLLLGVVDHAVGELGSRLSEAAVAARPARGRRSASGPTLEDRLVAVVDATFRLGTTHPELLAVVREVTRVGPPASTHLAAAVEPLVDAAAAALDPGSDREHLRRVLLAAGARVVGIATEAEVRADLGLAPDLTWLRARRRALIDSLTTLVA
ncbi:TetR/AcrR family transcriptional regulator [Aquihabitans sp. G128]|uniref:TetR/AcrR family transcriptional regulator n=1 Tax=Aquihabitans sp. G128 TaxID=2849779 RepID=UPI001C2292E0|nr:TetR/AcrR family transcriptional regulator [Aquihabitans sp. G128]QXC61749.1 TetR/AcrR family transcriptional regulator [Aquihabitans sp. G128]